MKIWAHTLVKNEENFVWFALMSVVDKVDKMLVWDTGSTDQTVKLIKDVMKRKPGKIEFRECGEVDAKGFTKFRQEMLDQSKCDWIMIVDGDEVWWKKSINQVIEEIKQNSKLLNGVVVPFHVAIGDIYHFQDETAGRYNILGRQGHLSLRFINRKINGLHVDLPYGKEGYFDSENVPIQNLDNIIIVNAPYLHLTHLKRSSVNRADYKQKIELGSENSKGFVYPEVFQMDYPKVIKDPYVRMSSRDLFIAGLLTPIKKIKRRFL